ncbi:MAG: HAD-IIB family hydrolase [Desulfobacterales bacterium]|nr:HAD-IIB family hydrolase [Desulfobacterales bacterium]
MAKKKLYIQMFSIHGLIRSENMELGRDADTGGQVNYVVELATHLSRIDSVDQVDLFTRLVVDKTVSEDYSEPIEQVNDKFRIVRIQCGRRNYIRKELLWPHLDEYVDNTIKFIKHQNRLPDVVHGHYADAGYVAMQISRIFGLPFIFTGHSMGRVKMQKLLGDGLKKSDIIKKYKIDTRIEAEEDILRNADLIITSTRQEVEKQYGQYRFGENVDFEVFPPGIDIQKFHPYYHNLNENSKKPEQEYFAKASLIHELDRFFLNPEKPIILTLCRPDKRKNISGLIKAFGEDKELQAIANLAIFAGIRKDIESMEDNERDVLTQMLLSMDKYDLYGKMAIPKKHDFEYEVPELYRIVADKKGVFVNSALTEPFGLTLLEASSAGLPIVSTDDGGPHDIIHNCKNGILINASRHKEISEAIKRILVDSEKWSRYSKNGILNVQKYYTWESHAKKYIERLNSLMKSRKVENMKKAVPTDAIGKRLTKMNAFIISDIDNTLIGKNNDALPELINYLNKNKNHIAFGVATGRTIDSAVNILKKHKIPLPDVIISSVGTEIYYGAELHYAQGWQVHISNKWQREKIVKILRDVDFLEYQEEKNQRPFKISYNMVPGKDRLPVIHERLNRYKCQYSLIYSHKEYLDILPYRASKGKAIRYLSYKWDIPLSNFLVCGDSGNDEEMLKGEPLAVVVGNYSSEVEHLKGARNVYFADNKYSAGILEAIKKYEFLNHIKNKN